MYEFVRLNYFVGIFYFITLILLGRYLLINLFLALLLQNYNENNPEQKNLGFIEKVFQEDEKPEFEFSKLSLFKRKLISRIKGMLKRKHLRV